MPITSAAIKAARQTITRNARRQPHKTYLKTMIRNFSDLVKEGKRAEAVAMLPKVYKAIDTAAKKHLIHKNNAANKKSLMARMVADKK
jgi:small subunit ribosomal protein S20